MPPRMRRFLFCLHLPKGSEMLEVVYFYQLGANMKVGLWLMVVLMAAALTGCASSERVYLLNEREIPDRYYEMGKLFSTCRLWEIKFNEGASRFFIYFDDERTSYAPDIKLVYRPTDYSFAYAVGVDPDSAKRWEALLGSVVLHRRELRTFGGADYLILYLRGQERMESYSLVVMFERDSRRFFSVCYASPQDSVVCFDPRINIPVKK